MMENEKCAMCDIRNKIYDLKKRKKEIENF